MKVSPLSKEAYRVGANGAQSEAERKRRLINHQRRIQWRLCDRQWVDRPRPMFAAGNIQYELADRARDQCPVGAGAGHGFKRFVNAFVRVPCQVVRTGGRVVYRPLAWNRWQHMVLRGVDALRSPLRC